MSARVFGGPPPEVLKRQALEDRIEQMIALLDALDGDPDLEGHSVEYDPNDGARTVLNADLEEDRADEEYSLGWSGASQLRLTAHDDGDRTAPETAGAGFRRCVPDDCEPSLGSLNSEYASQANWSWSGTDDREQDAGDEGEMTEDEEPTLGWNEAGCTSGGDIWSGGEAEPSLGSIGSCGRESMPQTVWGSGGRSDLERDAGDEPELDHEDEHWRQLPRLDVRMSEHVGAKLLAANENG